MAEIKKSILINVPVEKVFDYIADQKNQTEWIASMVEIWDTSEPAVGAQYKWKYKMVGVLLDGETTVTELVPNKRYRTQSKGAADSNWLFLLDSKDGGTELELIIDYSIPIPVLGKIAERIILKRNDREADLAVENIKMILED